MNDDEKGQVTVNVIAYPGPGVAPRYDVPRHFLDQAAGRVVGRQD